VGVKVHPHPDLELIDAKPFGRRPALADSLYYVVRCRLDKTAVAETDPVDRLPAVVCRCDDTCNTARVVDLAPNLVVVDELSDWNHPVGG